jgi:hypothetical protein
MARGTRPNSLATAVGSPVRAVAPCFQPWDDNLATSRKSTTSFSFLPIAISLGHWIAIFAPVMFGSMTDASAFTKPPLNRFPQQDYKCEAAPGNRGHARISIRPDLMRL